VTGALAPAKILVSSSHKLPTLQPYKSRMAADLARASERTHFPLVETRRRCVGADGRLRRLSVSAWCQVLWPPSGSCEMGREICDPLRAWPGWLSALDAASQGEDG
jgi:hypothetical protein